jgi:hypothetical protein
MDKEQTEDRIICSHQPNQSQVPSPFKPRLQEQNQYKEKFPSLIRNYNVNEAQEEVLTLSFLVSQLMLRSTWVGTKGHTDILSTALLTVTRMMSGLLVPIVPAIQSKMKINARKYPPAECKKSNTVQHYTQHADKTGIRKDSDVPLFQDINNIQYVPKHSWFVDAGPSKSQPTVNEDQLYYGNLRDFDDNFDLLMAQVEDFATERNWINKYTDMSVYMSLLSEIGELSSVTQWSQPHELLITLSIQKRDQLARELCDIIIYLLHFCRLKHTKIRLHHNPERNNLYSYWGRYVFPLSYNIHNQDTLLLQHEAQGPHIQLLSETQPQAPTKVTSFLEIRGMNDIVYKILYMLTGDGFHVYSDVHPDLKYRNPPERQRLYYLSVLGFKALTNLMIASKPIRTLINSTREQSTNDPTVYNPYPYSLIRERLVVEKGWQSWYTLQDLQCIEKPYITDQENLTDPGAEEPPQWLLERWVYLTLRHRTIVERPCPISGLPTDPVTRPELYHELNPEARSFDTMELEVHVEHTEFSDDHRKQEVIGLMKQRRLGQTKTSYLRTHTYPHLRELEKTTGNQQEKEAIHQNPHPDPEAERQLYYADADHRQIKELEKPEHRQQRPSKNITTEYNSEPRSNAAYKDDHSYPVHLHVDQNRTQNQVSKRDTNSENDNDIQIGVPKRSFDWDSDSREDNQKNDNNETSPRYSQLDIRRTARSRKK